MRINYNLALILISLFLIAGCSETQNRPVQPATVDETKSAAQNTTVNISDIYYYEQFQDLNNDGKNDQVKLFKRDADLILEVTSGNKVVERLIQSENTDKKADNMTGSKKPAVKGIYKLDRTNTKYIVIEFKDVEIGNYQLMFYSFNNESGLENKLCESFAIDSGRISLKDIDNDGEYERERTLEFVTRYYKYKLVNDKLTWEFHNAIPTQSFDLSKPEHVVKAFIYYQFNEMPEYSEKIITNKSLLYTKLFLDPDKDGSDLLFAGVSRQMYHGEVKGEFEIVENKGDYSVVRATDRFDTDFDKGASFIFSLEKQSGTWKIVSIKPDTDDLTREAIKGVILYETIQQNQSNSGRGNRNNSPSAAYSDGYYFYSFITYGDFGHPQLVIEKAATGETKAASRSYKEKLKDGTSFNGNFEMVVSDLLISDNRVFFNADEIIPADIKDYEAVYNKKKDVDLSHNTEPKPFKGLMSMNLDGSDIKCLYAGYTNRILSVGDKIWFLDKDKNVCNINKDGGGFVQTQLKNVDNLYYFKECFYFLSSNKLFRFDSEQNTSKQIQIENECHMPMFLDNDEIFYINNAGKIFKYGLTDKASVLVADCSAKSINTDGMYIYYIGQGGNVFKMCFDGKEKVELYSNPNASTITIVGERVFVENSDLSSRVYFDLNGNNLKPLEEYH